MLNEIQSLIDQKKYGQALEIIEDQISKMKDLALDANEQDYSKLMSFRVTVNTALGRTDEVIRAAVRKEKFPSEQSYTIADRFPVTVYEKDLFQFGCDAMINSIHSENLFTVSERSATHGFVSRLGGEYIAKQIDLNRKYSKGSFLVLEHDGLLAAPLSYHILCYEGNRVDMDALEEGLRAVLKDAERRNLKTVGSFPLGFGYIASYDEKERGNHAKGIADRIAETVVSHLWESSRRNPPHIFINASRSDTFETLGRAFLRWSSMDRGHLAAIRNMEERHKTLVQESCATGAEHIQTLKKISYTAVETSTILLLGETGVGKSFLADRIHKLSPRASKPFKSINCAYIRPDHLFTHLFGWKRGSFTGATEDGKGLIEAANEGTLFLDEIGYADISVQRGLLTLLDKGNFHRFGETIERQSDVRFIFGTNQDLTELVLDGRFAHDLFERISQAVFEIPPLRKRKEDIPLLIQKIAEELNHDKDHDIIVDKDAQALLREFKWPGNIRQLRYHIENLFIECVHHTKTYVITGDMVRQSPPRDSLYRLSDPIGSIESSLRNVMKKWDPADGKFIRDFVEPIIAKIYVDDLKLSKTDATRLIGLDGSRGGASTLDSRYREYDILKKKFSKE